MTIAAILAGRDWDTITVQAGTSVAQVVTLLADKRIGAVPVMKDGEVIGIMSERDVIYHLQTDGPGMLEWPVERAMTAPAITIERDMTVLAALGMMTRRRVRHLPVVDEGRLVGFVSIGDLVKRRIDGIEQEAAALRDYIQST